MADVDEAPSTTPVDEQQLWTELQNCLSAECHSHEAIDDALRTWLDVTTKLRDAADLDSQDEIVDCAQMLVASQLFRDNREYVRTQIIHSLLQEDDTSPLHAITCLLLLDGSEEEATFTCMIDEACFPRLLELMDERREGDPRLYRLLLALMYEMSRIERLRPDDLSAVDDDFIHHLFQIIEGVSNDVHDPYHYPTIRVLLVLNEQYMLASTDTAEPDSPTTPLTNRIVKCLSLYGPSFRTFGENIILLLNRETETSLQLLTLKLLYLLFTTKATYEYFYTNDLRVLLDVIIRNLMDLPDEKISLRHTYLRVLYPLLSHTQLSQPPHYKKDEVLRVLSILRGSQNMHFAPADETTLRLVDRVAKVSWLEEDDEERGKKGSGEAEVARKFLGISLSRSQTSSSISVLDVAAVMEKPGVQTPSRHQNQQEHRQEDHQDNEQGAQQQQQPAPRKKKPLPEVPKHTHGKPFSQVSPTTTATPTIQINGEGKKVPPKAPPPRRRGRMKSAEMGASIETIPEKQAEGDS